MGRLFLVTPYSTIPESRLPVLSILEDETDSDLDRILRGSSLLDSDLELETIGSLIWEKMFHSYSGSCITFPHMKDSNLTHSHIHHAITSWDISANFLRNLIVRYTSSLPFLIWSPNKVSFSQRKFSRCKGEANDADHVYACFLILSLRSIGTSETWRLQGSKAFCNWRVQNYPKSL